MKFGSHLAQVQEKQPHMEIFWGGSQIVQVQREKGSHSSLSRIALGPQQHICRWVKGWLVDLGLYLWPSITKGLSLEDGQASEMHGASNTHSVINDNNNTGEVDEGISMQCHATYVEKCDGRAPRFVEWGSMIPKQQGRTNPLDGGL